MLCICLRQWWMDALFLFSSQCKNIFDFNLRFRNLNSIILNCIMYISLLNITAPSRDFRFIHPIFSSVCKIAPPNVLQLQSCPDALSRGREKCAKSKNVWRAFSSLMEPTQTDRDQILLPPPPLAQILCDFCIF
jgi:hypothetical protein